MANEEQFLKIQEFLDGLKGEINVLDEQIDIDVQIEYFEASREAKKELDPAFILADRDKIFSLELDHEQKKILLLQLASIESVEAYRAIEQFKSKPDDGLKDWAALALQESRMILESHFLEQSQLFISTGMGGRANKLRYFVVFLLKSDFELDDLRKKIIKNELEFFLKKETAELESISFESAYVSIKVLLPLQTRIQECFDEILVSCNQFGDFLSDNYIITNVKELSNEEIIELLNSENTQENK